MRPSKNTIKYIKSLQLKKFRQKYNNFVVEGDKMLNELLRDHSLAIERLFLLPDWADRHHDWLLKRSLTFEVVDEAGLKQLSALISPQAGLALVQQPQLPAWPDPQGTPVILYLDGIQDPGNLGSILRIADWFGISETWCAPGTVDVYSPKVIQAAMGAFLRVTVRQNIELDQLPLAWQEIEIWGADLAGESVHQLSLSTPTILAIGSEGKGLSAMTMTRLQKTITIPAPIGRGAESLNAAVATGIICAVLLADV